MKKEKVYVLYDGRGEEDGQVACCAMSVKELKRDSRDWPEDYQWWEHDVKGKNLLVNAQFHSFAGDHYKETP